jgi:aspartyl/glutamyl-tRNA(Asn/Gln) amidotransferase, C subunit
MTKENFLEYQSMAKFNLPEKEIDLLLEKANNLEKSFAEISTINTENVEPLISVLNLKNIMAEDIAVKVVPLEDILSNAPDRDDEYFRVPKTLD